jgi:hypothetical protein
MGDSRIWLGNDKVNQAANAVLVTSGAINESMPTGIIMRTKVVVSSTVTVGLTLQLRDASDVVVWGLKFGIAANVPMSDLVDFEFEIPNSYRWTVIANAAYTGTVHAHILGKIVSGY